MVGMRGGMGVMSERPETSLSPQNGITVRVEDGVGHLVLDRPAKRNAVDLAMWRAIPAAVARLDDDPEVGAIVLSGAGEHFCAGADIGDLLGGPDPRDPMAELRAANLAAQAAILGARTPTVALVRGHCIGGGLEIAAAADLRFAATTATVGVTPAKLGVVYTPESITGLVALVGPGAATYLLYGAEILDAAWALRVGLFDVVVEPGELAGRVAAFVAGMAGRSRLTVASVKESVGALLAGDDPGPRARERYLETIAAGELAEGVAAFRERRAPRFPWRP